MKFILILNIALLSSWATASTRTQTQTQTFSPAFTGSGSGTLLVVGQQGIVKSGFTPFDPRQGTLNSFTVSWDSTFSTSGVVGGSASGSINVNIGGNFGINNAFYNGNGGGNGMGGNPDATLGPINIPISDTKVFRVAEAGSSYDPAILATVTGNSNFSLAWLNSPTPLASVNYSNLASLTSSLAGSVTITYDYTPTKYRDVDTFAGSGTSGSTDATGTTASFNGPWGISADAQGNLYHTDYTGKRIRRTTPSGVVNFIDAFSSFPPIATAIDPATGHLYVSIETHRIIRYLNKNPANYPAQEPVYGPETDFPDATIVYAGSSTSGTTNATGINARFNAPHGLHVRDGILYVADKGNNRIRGIDLSNAAVTTVTVTGGTLSGPEGLWVAEDGTIYVACTGSHLIQKIAPNGALSTVAGSVSGNVDGVGPAARFNNPRGLAVNSRGEIFVADSGNHAIRRISPDGTVVTVAGGSASGAYLDGSGAAARFNSPRGVAFGADEILYVADFGNHRIRSVNATQPRIVAASDSLAGFTAAGGAAGQSQSLIVTAEALEGELTVTAPAGYEVAWNDGSYAASLTVDPEKLAGQTATFQLRLAADAAVGSVSGNLVIASAEAADLAIPLSGRVLDITPTLTSLGGFSSAFGTASASQSFEFSGNTGESYTITAPPGYEVSLNGGDFAASRTFAGVSRTFGTSDAIAALMTDGSVVPWGFWAYGGDSSTVASQLASGVTTIIPSNGAFAALKSDGSVVTWGNTGGGGNSSMVSSSLASGVTAVYSSGNAFAALKSDGSVVTWGVSYGGGDSSAVASQLSSGVVEVFPGMDTFAALKSDGSVITWGVAALGGDSSAVSSQLSSGVSSVVSNSSSFAALKTNGSVVTWGFSTRGGDSSPVASQLSSGVVSVFRTTEGAYAALKDNGSVVTWGDSQNGGDSSSVASALASGVSKIFNTRFAFAALKSDGSVVTWGGNTNGGNSSAVSSQLASGVIDIRSTSGSFAALKADGSLVTWGNSFTGGDSSGVAASLATGVAEVYGNNASFAAVLKNGNIVTWGSAEGGNSSSVSQQLADGVEAIFPAMKAYVAVKSNGTAVVWGAAHLSGSSLPSSLPVSPPTVQVRLAADAPPGTVSGDLTITSGPVTRSVSLTGSVDGGFTPLQAWRQQHFGTTENSGNAADLATPDGDGIANLMKYALGLTPGQNGAGGLPKAKIATNSGSRYLSLNFRRDPSRDDVTIVVEVQSSLGGGWTEIARSVNGAVFTGAAGVTETENSDGTMEVEIRDTQTIGSAARRFMRVRVETMTPNLD